MGTQHGATLCGDVHAIQPDCTGRRCQDADHQSAQRALPGPGWPDDPQELTRLDIEAARAEYRALVDIEGDAVECHRAGRWRQGERVHARRRVRQQYLQPPPALARLHQRTPAREHLLDRCQRPAQEDRARDHPAGGQLAPQHQQRAKGHHAGLDHQPRGPGDTRHHAAALVGMLLQDQHLIVQLRETGLQVGQDAHGGDDLALAPQRIDLPLRLGRERIGVLQPTTRHDIAHHREHGKQQRADQPEVAEHRMQEPHQRERDRQPRRVEDRRERGARHRLTQLGQVAQALTGITGLRPRREEGRGQPGAQAGREPGQHRGADRLQQAQRHQGQAGDQHQGNQCVPAATAEDTIEHLKREDRHRQHQHADGETDQPGDRQRRTSSLGDHASRCSQRLDVHHDALPQ